jgi:hypothetical protein
LVPYPNRLNAGQTFDHNPVSGAVALALFGHVLPLEYDSPL